MKLTHLVATSLFAITTALTLNASAASETPADAKPDISIDRDGMQKMMKPHTRMAGQSGMSPNGTKATAEHAAAEKTTIVKSKNKHVHSRDGGRL